ncbi:MAG TPA: hypothetical protein VGK54_09225 [Chloroflexota bacterium]
MLFVVSTLASPVMPAFWMVTSAPESVTVASMGPTLIVLGDSGGGELTEQSPSEQLTLAEPSASTEPLISMEPDAPPETEPPAEPEPLTLALAPSEPEPLTLAPAADPSMLMLLPGLERVRLPLNPEAMTPPLSSWRLALTSALLDPDSMLRWPPFLDRSRCSLAFSERMLLSPLSRLACSLASIEAVLSLKLISSVLPAFAPIEAANTKAALATATPTGTPPTKRALPRLQ